MKTEKEHQMLWIMIQLNGNAGWFVTYEVIGYGFTSGKARTGKIGFKVYERDHKVDRRKERMIWHIA